MRTATDTRKRPGRWITRPGGFTLVEMLVVITIILLVSAVTLPAIVSAVGNRQLGDSARILQAAISGARDAAIRADAPRGIRLLPDTSAGFNIAPFTDDKGNFHPGVLTFNRMIPIEPGPEFSQGLAQIVQDASHLVQTGNPTYYSAYPYTNATYTTYPNGIPSTVTSSGKQIGKVLRIEEQAFSLINGSWVPNNPTSWWWNIRVGDKLRIDDSGQYYTVVGPITIHPTPSNLVNPELFVNDGNPGDVRATSGLQYSYGGNTPVGVEFLYLVNGHDDDLNGFIDDGWDGIDNNLLNGADDIVPDAVLTPPPSNTYNYGEWENESWLGSLSRLNSNTAGNDRHNLRYTITRRPVPSPSAREITLPAGTVIDATTWNSTTERSRLPIDPTSLTVDIMVNQSGEVVPTLSYSTPASFNISGSFYHFWIADRDDVHDPGSNTSFPSLPMTEGTPYYETWPIGSSSLFLKKDRVLMTLFTRSGLVVTNSVENFQPGNKTDLANYPQDSELPYRGAQLGTREVK